MKPQIYTYVITPQEFSLLLTKLTADKDAKVQNHDGTYTVNAHGVEGTFSYDTVKNVVTITLDKKPLLLPASFIKKAFDEHIAEVRQDIVDARNGGAPIPTPVQIPKNTIDFKIPGEQFTPSPPSATNPPSGSAIAGTTPINPSVVTAPPAPLTAKAAQPTVTSDKTLTNPVSGNAKIE